MQRVRNGDRERVKENSGCFGKSYTMIQNVGFRLVWIPIKLRIHAENIRNPIPKENGQSEGDLMESGYCRFAR